MKQQKTTEISIPKIKRTREEALVWARGLVSKGIRVVRLGRGRIRRNDGVAALGGSSPRLAP